MTVDVIDVLGAARVLPVVTVRDLDTVAGLSSALVRGGFRALEITLRTPIAIDAIQQIRGLDPDVVIGAGSVMSAFDAERAIEAGAQFLVSPGFDSGVVGAGRERAVPVIPGAATATEVQAASNAGVGVVKVFPAELIGGVRLIDAFSAVWPGMRFMPSGGITAELAPAYLSHRAVVAVGGSWMMSSEAVASKDWDQVTTDARDAVELGARSR